MFSSVGLFRDLSCPKGLDCELLSCVFAHNSAPNGHTDSQQEEQTSDPTTAGGTVSPPHKRRRLDKEVDLNLKDHPQRVTTYAEAPGLRAVLSNVKSEPKSTVSAGGFAKGLTKLPVVKSTQRGVSPPISRRSKNVPPEGHKGLLQSTPRRIEALNPRIVSRAPETHAKRQAFLLKLHEQMERLNEQTTSSGDEQKYLILNEQQIITLALDEEEELAKQHGEGIYRSAIAGRIMSFKRMSIADWGKHVLQKFPVKNPFQQQVQGAGGSSTAVVTGLSSVCEEMAVLRHLRTPLEGLEKYGYVTTPPSEQDISNACKGVETAAGFEVCDRCGTRFRVFPGRDDQGRLTSQGPCRYHWAKVFRPAKQKTDSSVGQQQASYPCCNKGLGTEGCTTAEHHVFKVTDPKRLASFLQFKSTPATGHHPGKVPGAIAYDCEMGYTTQGMELIRLTAVSWPEGRELLDVLVRPQGEILDLNTRFSGVSAGLWASALDYESKTSDHGDDTSEEGEVEPEPLRKASSPSAARELLFGLLTPQTPLIGHAIDNDLNVCRIIHPFVVDTVLLYPHPRGLPVRYGLKMLTSKYLDRGIQMGGPIGHDSKEDAIATGDLVRLKVKEKWSSMKLEGWAFKDGRLIKPEEDDKPSS